MNRQASQSRLILIELLFAVLCFALASAFCLQVFAKAHMISERTKQENAALALLTTAVSYLKAEDGDFSALSARLNFSQSGQMLSTWYDKNWNACSKGQEMYAMTLEKTGNETYFIQISSKDALLLTQEIIFHSPVTKAEAAS